MGPIPECLEPAGDSHRGVPGRDEGAHSQRKPAGDKPILGAPRRVCLPVESEHHLGVIAQYRYGLLHPGTGFANWLPELHDGEANQLFGPFLQVLGYIGQGTAADGSRLPAPLENASRARTMAMSNIVWPRLLELPYNSAGLCGLMHLNPTTTSLRYPAVFQSYLEWETHA